MSLKPTALRVLNALQKAASVFPAIGYFRPLRGSFSAADRISKGELQGEFLAHQQPAGACPPGSMTEAAGFQQHDHQPWPLFWARSDDARLVGKMLLWRDPTDLICQESVYGLNQRRRLGEDKLSAQLIVPDPKVLSGAWTSISSNWNDGSNYYHWMLDGLARLSIRDTLPEKTQILLPRNLPRFAAETIALLGLDSDSLSAPSDCVKPERYYFCAPTAMTGVWNPHGCQWLRKSFALHFGLSGSGPPVFLTRRNGARIPENIGDIESHFMSRGFEIIDCGTISVKEQIRKTSSAPAIAGLHGAAMTNLLWAAPETPVLEIFQPGYLNGCYEQIAFEGALCYQHLINDSINIVERLKSWCQSSSV